MLYIGEPSCSAPGLTDLAYDALGRLYYTGSTQVRNDYDGNQLVGEIHYRPTAASAGMCTVRAWTSRAPGPDRTSAQHRPINRTGLICRERATITIGVIVPVLRLLGQNVTTALAGKSMLNAVAKVETERPASRSA